MQKLLKTVSTPGGLWAFSVASFFFLLLGVAWFPTADVDVAMYLAISRRVLNAGHIPSVDPFIFSIENYRWHIEHQWLGYFPWYFSYSLFGENGLVALKFLMLILIFSIPLSLAFLLKNRSMSTVLIMSIALGAATLRLSERTSLFSDFFQCLVLAILTLGLTGRPKLLRSLPVIFLVWVNLHPGFHPGLFIVGLALLCFGRWPLDQATKEFAAIFLLSILATFVNPLGWHGFIYPLQTVASNQWDIMRIYNLEWLPTFGETFRGSFAVRCWSLMIAGVLVLSFWSRQMLYGSMRRLWIWLFSTSILLIVYGSYSTRFMAVSSYSLMALMVVWISLYVGNKARSDRQIRLAIPCAVFVIGVWSLLFGTNINGISRKFGSGFDLRFFPIEAAKWYHSHQQPSGNIWNDHAFGSYLAFAWDGSPKIFYHGFMDDMIFYGTNYVNMYQARSEFDRIVTQFNIKTFFIRSLDLNKPNNPMLYLTLKNHNAFKMVYFDNATMIFIRP